MHPFTPSHRPDGRGHWPTGRRRNTDCPAALRRRLRTALRRATRQNLLRPTASAIGLSARQLARYRDDIHHPTAATARTIIDHLR